MSSGFGIDFESLIKETEQEYRDSQIPELSDKEKEEEISAYMQETFPAQFVKQAAQVLDFYV